MYSKNRGKSGVSIKMMKSDNFQYFSKKSYVVDVQKNSLGPQNRLREDRGHHRGDSNVYPQHMIGGRTGLEVRASDSGSGDPCSVFDPRLGRCVDSLSKRHLLPKSIGNTQE